MTVNEEKALLRKLMKEKRGALGEKRAEYSKRICKTALSLPMIKDAGTVLAYSAIGSEADIASLCEALLKMGKRVAFPKCLEDGVMEFYFVSSLSELSRGKMGIGEPPAIASRKAEREHFDIFDICLVPALAMDASGSRLGYGGGYYDRYLSDFPGIKIGICFEDCIADAVFAESTDIRTDYIITEKGVKGRIED